MWSFLSGNGIDYQFEARDITIKAGTDSAKFNVTIIDDLFVSFNISFNLTITHFYSSFPYEIYGGLPKTTMITIKDDECKYPFVAKICNTVYCITDYSP